jgi:hypothetical protein
MNERIKELAVQAGHRYYPSSNSGPLRVEYLTPELEKFAELIVQECMKMCDEVHRDYGMASDTARISKRYIKKHFGVEE